VVDEAEEEDEDEDNSKECRTIGQGEMVNTLADDANTMVVFQPTILPEQGQGLREHTPWPQPLMPAPGSQPPALCPRPRTAETQTCSGLDVLELVTPQ
jgi:hypothetical protein